VITRPRNMGEQVLADSSACTDTRAKV